MMKRREFIRNTAMTIPAISLFPAELSSMSRESRKGKLEKRELGKTGIKLSVIGFGGIVVMNANPEESSFRVKEAIDYGVNYFDVAPSYGDAEVKLGPALEPYRKKVFLACKTNKRNASEAEKELDQSLKNLRTDHFDLYQLHAVTNLSEVDEIFGKGGAMEAFIKAREDKRIRLIGFSAHSVEAATELMKRFDFNTILFPINFNTWYAGNFGPQVLQTARDKGMGILALKAMANQPWKQGAPRTVSKVWYEPLTNPAEALTGLRFTLSHPVTSAIPPGNEDLFRLALKLGLKFKPLSAEESLSIKEKGLNGIPIFRYPA